MDNNIYFSLPGFFSHKFLNLTIIDLKTKNPNYFNDNVIIDSVYDCFPPSIWNGGRTIYGFVSVEEMQKTLMAYNLRGISVRHTFTNSFLEEKHLYDTFSNKILEISKDTIIKTGITLNSELLKEYIEKEYPNCFYFNWSATKCLKDVREINLKSKEDFVVPSYQDINNNFDILNQLAHPNHVELIVDEGCQDNCPYRKSHYESFNKVQLLQASESEQCPYADTLYYYGRKQCRSHNISIDLINNKYLPLGFNHFKITGREDFDINLIESYVHYLIKPEFQNIVRNILLVECYHKQPKEVY